MAAPQGADGSGRTEEVIARLTELLARCAHGVVSRETPPPDPTVPVIVGMGRVLDLSWAARRLVSETEQLLRDNLSVIPTKLLEAGASVQVVWQTTHYWLDYGGGEGKWKTERSLASAESLRACAIRELDRRRLAAGLISYEEYQRVTQVTGFFFPMRKEPPPAADATQVSGPPAVTRSKRETRPLTHGDQVNAVAFTADGRRVATGSTDKTAKVWHLSTGREVVQVAHDAAVNDVAISPDGALLASAGADGRVRLWKLATDREVFHIAHERGLEFLAVAFSPGGDRLATGSQTTAQVWQLATHQKLVEVSHGGGYVFAVAFSPNGALLATAGMDKFARVWELATGREAAKFRHRGFANWLHDVAFSPDGTLLATGDHKTARVWDLATGQEVTRLRHEGQVEAVAFSADGARLATGSLATARVWDLATSEEIVRIPHPQLVFDVALSKDGRLLATSGGDRTALVRAIPR